MFLINLGNQKLISVSKIYAMKCVKNVHYNKKSIEPPEVRLTGDDSDKDQPSTADMFKDMLTQKKNMLFSKLTSFDSDVSQTPIQPHVSIYVSFELFLSIVKMSVEMEQFLNVLDILRCVTG